MIAAIWADLGWSHSAMRSLSTQATRLIGWVDRLTTDLAPHIASWCLLH
jgi:hypothetical protein